MAVAIGEAIVEAIAASAEIGTAVAAESAAAAEAAAVATEVETTGVVAEEVATVLESSLGTAIEETVGDEVTATVSQDVDAVVETEVEEAIEEGESDAGASTSPTPTYKIILKWVNRLALCYTLVDSIGREIYNQLHPPPGEPKPLLTPEQQKELEDLHEATTELKLVLEEMKKTMQLLKSEDLGSVAIGKNSAYVSDILNSLLAIVNQVNLKHKALLFSVSEWKCACLAMLREQYSGSLTICSA